MTASQVRKLSGKPWSKMSARCSGEPCSSYSICAKEVRAKGIKYLDDATPEYYERRPGVKVIGAGRGMRGRARRAVSGLPGWRPTCGHGVPALPWEVLHR